VSRLVETAVPDDVLVAARQGDDRAQALLYEAVAPGVFALIRRLTGGRAQAEDLFQDTMMIVYQRLADFRGEAPIGAWVRQIAVTKCLMYLRSPWHRARMSLDLTGPDETANDRLMPSIQAPAAETLDVERALASLAPTARAIVWLFEVEGYSHEEIAKAFGKSVSFSKSQLARAHARLREWFEPSVDRQTCTLI
jgi:RNA polymerase sigma factor (sigma-70 family)